MKNIRYILSYQHPETTKQVVSIIASTLEKMRHRVSMNLLCNKDWYTDRQGGRLKLKLVAQSKTNGKWTELEEYKLTKDWKVKGYFEWDKISKGSKG